jgi:4-amino-4-deoxy-L-arabinose transferase-like glycosyltransferase
MPVTTAPPPLRHALAGALVLGVVVGWLFLWHAGAWPLLDPDEARHAEVAREMATGHGPARFFLPTFEHEPYREKPAGYYWLVTLAFALGGAGEVPARAAGALASLAAVLALYAWALPREGLRGALGAALVAATSAGWFGLSRYATLDMTLTALVVIGVLAGLAWLDRAPPRRPPLAPWICAGLGTLVKGPVAIALVAGPLLLAALVRRPRPALRELGLVRGALVLIAIVAVLYVPTSLLDPGYLRAFLDTNLRRFRSTSPHAGPAWVYLMWIPLLFLPWTLLGVPAVVRAARDRARLPLVLWAAWVPILLSLPRGKLPTYVLSALAPLALIVGPALARVQAEGPDAGDRRAFRAGGAVGVLVLVALAGAAPFVARDYPIGGGARAALGLAALAWAAVVVHVLRGDRLRHLPLVVLGAALTLYPLALATVMPAVGALHSYRDAARLAATRPGAPVFVLGARAPSLAFYLGAPPVHTEDLGLLRDRFAGDDLVFLASGRRHFDEIEAALGARAHVWHATPRWRLYASDPRPLGSEGGPRE